MHCNNYLRVSGKGQMNPKRTFSNLTVQPKAQHRGDRQGGMETGWPRRQSCWSRAHPVWRKSLYTVYLCSLRLQDLQETGGRLLCHLGSSRVCTDILIANTTAWSRTVLIARGLQRQLCFKLSVNDRSYSEPGKMCQLLARSTQGSVSSCQQGSHQMAFPAWPWPPLHLKFQAQ